MAYRQNNADQLKPMLAGCLPRSASASHDVVVGVSGGVDSSTVALLHNRQACGCWPSIWITAGIHRLLYRTFINWRISMVLPPAEVLDWNDFEAVQRAFMKPVFLILSCQQMSRSGLCFTALQRNTEFAQFLVE